MGVEVEQIELSRRLLLSDPKSGGFEFLEKTAPVYLASAGNDLDFASDDHDGKPDRQPVLVRLKTRCTECHDLEMVDSRSISGWQKMVGSMSRRAHLNDDQQARILEYLAAAENTMDSGKP